MQNSDVTMFIFTGLHVDKMHRKWGAVACNINN